MLTHFATVAYMIRSVFAQSAAGMVILRRQSCLDSKEGWCLQNIICSDHRCTGAWQVGLVGNIEPHSCQEVGTVLNVVEATC